MTALERLKFTCTGPQGVVQLIQCKKGTVKVPTYGTQPRELVNIMLNDPDGGQTIDGYVLPATAKALRPFGVKSGGDVDEQGAIQIYN